MFMKPVVKVGQDAITEAVASLTLIAEAVGSTLGPGGRPFAFDKASFDGRLQPSFSKDGLTVLRSLGFAEPIAEAVLAFCRQSASHTVLASGDGTTSTIVLAAEIAKQVLNSNSKWPQAFARDLQQQAERAVELIQFEAIKGDDIVRKVALTSTNGDEELTDIAIEAITRSSAFGAIVIDKNPATRTRYKIVTQDGYCHCRGYDYNNSLAWSASDKAASNETVEWAKPAIAIFNGDLMIERQLDPILLAWQQTLTEGSRNLVIVCYELSDEIANKLLVVNRTLAATGNAVFVVKPRLSAEINCGLQVLRDIAAFCGITDQHIIDGGNYKTTTAEFLGVCDKARISPTNTVFVGRAPDHWVDQRITQNLNIASEARCEADRELTVKRNAQLTEGLVKIEVGGGMLPDLQERADRLDDATKAAQACMRNGALPGCGVSFMRAALNAHVCPALAEAFRSIYVRIMNNYGADPIGGIEYQMGQTLSLSSDGIKQGQAVELEVLDATDTICAVIRNGVDLGVKIAILGGYSLRENIGSVIEEG
jgi:chaperonin GroEL